MGFYSVWNIFLYNHLFAGPEVVGLVRKDSLDFLSDEHDGVNVPNLLVKNYEISFVKINQF